MILGVQNHKQSEPGPGFLMCTRLPSGSEPLTSDSLPKNFQGVPDRGLSTPPPPLLPPEPYLCSFDPLYPYLHLRASCLTLSSIYWPPHLSLVSGTNSFVFLVVTPQAPGVASLPLTLYISRWLGQLPGNIQNLNIPHPLSLDSRTAFTWIMSGAPTVTSSQAILACSKCESGQAPPRSEGKSVQHSCGWPPASGPLYLLVPLPGALSPQVCPRDSFRPSSGKPLPLEA